MIAYQNGQEDSKKPGMKKASEKRITNYEFKTRMSKEEQKGIFPEKARKKTYVAERVSTGVVELRVLVPIWRVLVLVGRGGCGGRA